MDTDLRRFDHLRLQAHLLAEKAVRAKGIGDLQRAQMRAAAGLLGIVLHRTIGQPEPDDARALVKDLFDLASFIDPLIEALGEEAQSQFGGIDLKLFRNQLRDALDGNATYELEAAAERMAEDQAEIDADPRGWAKAHALGVD